MQLKNLFSFKNIKNFLIIAVIVFLTLPLLVPEKTHFTVLKKENIIDREESPLPIFPHDNLMEKYAKRFKKFYKFTKSAPLFQTPEDAVEEIKNEEISDEEDVYAEDLFFADDYEGDDYLLLTNAGNIQESKDNTVNLQKGIVLTSEGLPLEPTQEGYYYNGKFYKNGTYPDGANKRAIEGALNRYHSKVAGQIGKKALYYADEKGNLTVDYVDKLPNEISADIDSYRANNPTQINNKQFNKDNTLYAKAKSYNGNHDRYRGAHINGLNQRSNNGKNISYSDIAAASLRDMHSAYNMAINKIQTGEMGQDININPPQDIQQNIAKKYLDTLPSAQEAEKPESVPNYSGNQDEVLNIPVGKEKDFVEEFTEQISELSCSGGGNTAPAVSDTSFSNTFNMDMFASIDISSSAYACSAPPVNITQTPENMCESIVYNGDNTNSSQLTQAIAQKISESDKSFAEVISTQQNFPTLLSAQPQFINKNGKNVTLSHIAFGPNHYQDPKETKLSSYYESIINTIATDKNEANKLRESIDNYYDSVKDNLNKPTIFVSAADNGRIFIEHNPKTGYIGPLPKTLKGKNGEDFAIIDSQIHNGNWVSYKEFMNIIEDGNVNMYIVSNQATGNDSACTDNRTCFKSIKGEKAFSTQINDISENIDGQMGLTEQGNKTTKKEGKANADKLRQRFGMTPANQPLTIKKN